MRSTNLQNIANNKIESLGNVTAAEVEVNGLEYEKKN